MLPPEGEASKSRLLAMNAQDAEIFSRALLDIWPDIRFTNLGEVGCEWVDDGEGHKIIRPKKNLRYYESVAVEEESRFQVWREPEDWAPEWTGPINDHFRIVNYPRFQFVYESSRIYPGRPTHMHAGRIWAYYKKDDKEHLRFLNKVWRLTAKLSTNVLDLLDRDTGEVRRHSYRSMHWVGHHTIDWCRADPDRRIDQSWRHGTKPSNGE